MFLVVGMNANNQICPIAMGVGKSERGLVWTWFLIKLRECIGEPTNLTFVTDRASTIELAIRIIFQIAHHGLGVRHLLVNLCVTSKLDKGRKWIFWEVRKAYRVSDFDASMEVAE